MCDKHGNRALTGMQWKIICLSQRVAGIIASAVELRGLCVSGLVLSVSCCVYNFQLWIILINITHDQNESIKNDHVDYYMAKMSETCVNRGEWIGKGTWKWLVLWWCSGIHPFESPCFFPSKNSRVPIFVSE